MLNYQKFHYAAYYLEDKNGDFLRCSRRDCFARAEKPTKDNPWKQRWYYDPDQSMAIRLARTEENDTIHRFNQAWLKREERYVDDAKACTWEKTKNCDQKCEACTRKNTIRVLRLDKNWDRPEEVGKTEVKLGIASVDDLEEIAADAILYSELYAALNELEPNQRQLIFSLDFEGETRRYYAAKLGITHQAVTKRRAKAIEDLRELMSGEK
jgi:DNA-directed RNA polymerase specialized sigma subunit